MDDKTRNALQEKNQKLIDMVIERAKRDFLEDIDIIGLTGSFATGDFHEKSDLDLIIINNKERGWGIAEGFILGDVGYDIYCTPWETRIADQAALNSPGVSSLTDLKILYVAKPEALERLRGYQKRALEGLAQLIGPDCLDRAQKHLDSAKVELANTLLESEVGPVRYAAFGVAYHLINALVSMNNTCIKRGIKRYLEIVRALDHLPPDFESLYLNLLAGESQEALREAARALLTEVQTLYRRLRERFAPPPTPTYENLWGTYEELWCNCRNKVLDSTEKGDLSYAAHAAMGAQNYLDEMAQDRGTPRFDLMQYFDAKDLSKFRKAFLRAMGDYRAEYEKVGRPVLRFDTFDELYEYYMKKKES